MNIIKKLPIPISGLILALLSLGNLLQDIHPYLKYAFGAIGAILLILMILKVLLYPQDLRDDFENPVIASSSGTFSMSVMLSSTYLQPFTPRISCAIWIIGIALHILLMIYFTYRFVIRDFDIKTVYPTWWIVYVGITMAAITSPAHNLEEAGIIFLAIGFIAMAITLPLMIYRYIKFPDIPDMNKPVTCIYTALFSILIVGYVNTAQTISNEFLIGLYIVSCVLYIFSLYKLISYRNLEFYPSFSAFTFPFVISTIATKEIADLYPNIVMNNIAAIEMAISLILVVSVLMRYAKFLKNS